MCQKVCILLKLTHDKVLKTHTHNIFHNTYFHSIVSNINTKHRKSVRERESSPEQNNSSLPFKLVLTSPPFSLLQQWWPSYPNQPQILVLWQQSTHQHIKIKLNQANDTTLERCISLNANIIFMNLGIRMYAQSYFFTIFFKSSQFFLIKFRMLKLWGTSFCCTLLNQHHSTPWWS
jgi:hypothetical protein